MAWPIGRKEALVGGAIALTKLSLNLAAADQAIDADRDESHGCDRDLCRLSIIQPLPNLEKFQATQAISQAEPGTCSITHFSPKRSMKKLKTRSMKKLKTIAFGGLTALTLITVPLAMTHLAAKADGTGGPRMGHALEQLNLSADQTSQIEAIRADTKSQMQAVLTPEQQTAAAADGGHGWRQLNLSDAQRSQMQSIREASKAKIDAVLTADQRQQLATAQAAERAEGGGPGHGLDKLNLTADQSAQIEAIRTDTKSQMQAVLTPEQQTALESSGDQRGALRQLNLTDAQRSQMQAIREASKTKIDAVLTAEQRQQLEQMHQDRGGDRQGQPQPAQ